jgi:hypothetical protein
MVTPDWLVGEVIVEFRCGVRVMNSGGQWGHGDVYYVYQKDYHYDLYNKGKFIWYWRRDSRMFTREDAIQEATRRVLFEEARASENPEAYVVWAKARESTPQ